MDVVKRKLPGGLRLWVTLASLGFVAWALAGRGTDWNYHFRPRLVVAASGPRFGVVAVTWLWIAGLARV